MPKIVITEQDLTRTGGTSEDFDVVYIPGLVDTAQSCLIDEEGKYIGIPVNKPTLFTTVAEFVSLCGKKPAKFEKEQLYTDLKTVKMGKNAAGEDVVVGVEGGFKDSAIPYHRTMFEAGTYDPSYIMAKELLDAGLCVLYERINGDATYDVLTSEPADWATSYGTYYEDAESYEAIDSVSAPLFYGEFIPVKGVEKDGEDSNKTIVAPDFEADKYFDEKGDDYSVALTKVPADWTTNYEDYFERGNKKTYYSGTKIVNTDNTVEMDYSKLDERPDDWDTHFYNYYESVTRKASIASDKAPNFEYSNTKKYYSINNGINIKSIYNALSGVYTVDGYDGLQDLGNYSVKYLTSGGYPTYEYDGNSIVTKMVSLAEKRGDCVAFIDHTDNEYRQNNIDLPGSVYYTVKNDASISSLNGEFAAMFTPFATYNRTTSDHDTAADGTSTVIKSETTIRGSATYAYLTSLADSIKTNAPWLAIAGATRGVVRNLSDNGLTTIIPNGAADAMQPRTGVAVNAITDIKPYGNVIWGNRTLKNNGENLTATSFLNIRNLVSDVKKIVYRAARKLTYEQNNDILWINFKAEIAPTLDRMLSGYGISGYKFVRDYEHEKANEKATLCAKIVLYPVYPVEDFYITIVLEDDEITVE